MFKLIQSRSGETLHTVFQNQHNTLAQSWHETMAISLSVMLTAHDPELPPPAIPLTGELFGCALNSHTQQ
jgi:hypothetical protein